MGLVALVCAFVPLVGDFVAVRAGLIAVGFGWIGDGRVDQSAATNHRDAVLGGETLQSRPRAKFADRRDNAIGAANHPYRASVS